MMFARHILTQRPNFILCYTPVVAIALIVLGLVLPLKLFSTSAAYAATNIIVDTTADQLMVNGFCSLREAIESVNSGIQFDTCGPNSHGNALPANLPYIIVLGTQTYPLSLTGNKEDLNQTGDLDILASVTIQGVISSSTFINGVVADRVLHIDPAGAGGITVEISGVTITNGAAPDDELCFIGIGGCGGGILNNGGIVTITNSAVSDNQVAGTVSGGGGIFNDNSGTLNIINSVIADNQLTQGGGAGLYNGPGNILVITHTTISGNYITGLEFQGGGGGLFNNSGIAHIADSAIINNQANSGGGGIYSSGAQNFVNLNIANTTISGNSAKRHGGGLINALATVNLTHVTITNNTADSNNDQVGRGGGMRNFGGIVNLKNTIIAGNINNNVTGTVGAGTHDISEAPSPTPPYIITSLGYNIIGTVGPITFTSNTTGDRYGDPNGTTTPNAGAIESATAIDPELTGLSGNPAYHLPRSGSLALNAVPAANCTFVSGGGNPLFTNGAAVTTAQNNAIRPLNGMCDLGATEIEYVPLPLIIKDP